METIWGMISVVSWFIHWRQNQLRSMKITSICLNSLSYKLKFNFLIDQPIRVWIQHVQIHEFHHRFIIVRLESWLKYSLLHYSKDSRNLNQVIVITSSSTIDQHNVLTNGRIRRYLDALIWLILILCKFILESWWSSSLRTLKIAS